MINFIFLVNKLGQTRIAQYYTDLPPLEKRTLESELVRKCLSRDDSKCSIILHRNFKVIYRRYVSLYFIIGVDLTDENEYTYFSFIHLLVETLNNYFEKVCELDIIMNMEKVHYIFEEMVQNGNIQETCKAKIIEPLLMLDRINQ